MHQWSPHHDTPERPLPMLSPDPGAMELAESMIQEVDVMETVLRETVSSASDGEVLESGRTACGGVGDVRGPRERRQRSVSLSSCPWGSSIGTWHTHPSGDGIRHPQHSLPDFANVAFGELDASVVVGVDSSEAVVRAEDADASSEAFVRALGYDVSGPDDVADAIASGQIRSPTAARDRVRDALAPLTFSRTVPFPEVAAEVNTAAVPAMDTFECCPTCACAPAVVEGADVCGFREMHQRVKPVARQILGDVSIREEAFSTAVGIVVGSVVNEIVIRPILGPQ